MKLTMMRGLPASGKSTKAHQLMKEAGNGVRLNKDLLRTMLHFDKFTGRNEGITNDAEMVLARHYLKLGTNVIVDDTNMGDAHKARWMSIAQECEAKFEMIDMQTTWEECVIRDCGREKEVGRDVIVQMALQYGICDIPDFKGYVLCDLDGTLANIAHRLHHVQKEPKDWKSFFQGIVGDKVRIEVLDMLMEYEGQGYTVVLMSARPEEYREPTEAWLEGAVFKGYQAYLTLIMRRAGDKREDSEVKKEMFERYFKGRPIHAVIDDRPRVIRMWKELGLNVIDVGDGVEF